MTPSPSISACDPVNAERAKLVNSAIERAALQVESDAEKKNFHPLEAIPFFRRWPRSLLRNIVYTIIFNAMFAVLFTFLGSFGLLTSGRPISADRLMAQFGWNLVISNVIGFMFWGVMAAIDPLLRLVHQRSLVVVVSMYTVLGTVIVTLAFGILSLLPGFDYIGRWLFSPRQLFASFVVAFVVSLVMGVIWRRRITELANEIAFAEERARSESAERAATQASLRALQAQIEPHFLFNTLANVTSLIHTRPDDAKRMLEEFIAYLRSSLASSREAETTLAQEFALMRSFLKVLKVRMGARLATRFDLPDDLSTFHLPPMLIQPLVENAIKHGLEPKVEGGEVGLSALHVGEMVHIVVTDTGMGFQNSTSNGLGLTNVRERLDKLYGGRASLSIEDNQPSGTRITIALST